MKYLSTRGKVAGLSFEEALFSGYAQDGGILMPESIPVVSMETLNSWIGLSYTDLAKKITPMFVAEDEIPQDDLFDLIDVAVKKIQHPDVAPIVRLPNGLNILELFHGVTWAFKDLPMSFVGVFLSYFLSKRNKHITILTATSGDTGSAAVECVRGQECVDIICLLPLGRCSRVQELQMTTVTDSNVHIYRVDTMSDGLDVVVKACFTDVQFAEKHNLASINSINWTRIMIQIVHYFYSYLQMSAVCGEEMEIVVPTGGCGNLVAGCIARKMGLPIKIVCAVNKNDVLAHTIEKGDYSPGEAKMSLAPAMDIQVIYNMERVWHLFANGDCTVVSQMMDELERTGKTQVPDTLKQKIQLVVSTYVVDDDVIKKTMKKCWEENKYLICPHTSTAVAYHNHQLQQTSSHNRLPQICFATASPAKFQEAVAAAALEVPANDAVSRIESLPTKYKDLHKDEDWNTVIRNKIVEVSDKFVKKHS